MKFIKGNKKTYKIDQNDCFWTMLCRLDEKQAVLTEEDIRHKCGVYIFWDWDDKPIRIGIGTKLRNRILSYSYIQNWYVFEDMHPHIAFVSVIYTRTQIEAQVMEKDLIQQHKPRFNYRHRDCYEVR